MIVHFMLHHLSYKIYTMKELSKVPKKQFEVKLYSPAGQMPGLFNLYLIKGIQRKKFDFLNDQK